MASKKWIILQASPARYFAGLDRGHITWTDDPANAHIFHSKPDAAETARMLQRRNGHQPGGALLVIAADRAALQDGS